VSFIAGKGYDSNAVVQAIQQRHMKVVIPPKENRTEKRRFSRKLYQIRHFVENFFCKIKRYRRVATRYEKTATNFLGFDLQPSSPRRFEATLRQVASPVTRHEARPAEAPAHHREGRHDPQPAADRGGRHVDALVDEATGGQQPRDGAQALAHGLRGHVNHG
jgi:hypothetical protein